jgi:Protein of unknown function (DUF3102)
MSDLTTTTNLDDLLIEIVKAHRAVEEHGRQMMLHALAAGDALISAKGAMKHGEWYDWLEINVPFTTRMAQNYMKLASQPAEIRNAISHLTLTAALGAIAASKEKTIEDSKTIDGDPVEEEGAPIETDLEPNRMEDDQSDDPDPDDLAPDEKAIRWAQETAVRLGEDIRDDDLDGLVALSHLQKFIAAMLAGIEQRIAANSKLPAGATASAPAAGASAEKKPRKQRSDKGQARKPKVATQPAVTEPTAGPAQQAPRSAGNDIDTHASADARKAALSGDDDDSLDVTKQPWNQQRKRAA